MLWIKLDFNCDKYTARIKSAKYQQFHCFLSEKINHLLTKCLQNWLRSLANEGGEEKSCSYTVTKITLCIAVTFSQEAILCWGFPELN